MGYPLPPYRPRPKPRPAPARPSALSELMKPEFDAKPFGSHGAMLPPAAPPPQPPPKPVIPPPPWQDELEAGDLDLASLEPPPSPTDGMTALEVMKLNDNGYQPEPWRPPAPPVQPLVPVEIPEPNWRAEEIERARRDRKQPELDEPQKSLKARPA